MASVESGGSALLQCSQVGRSSSIRHIKPQQPSACHVSGGKPRLLHFLTELFSSIAHASHASPPRRRAAKPRPLPPR